METEVPLLGVAVCVWARDRYGTENPPQPVLQQKHWNWERGRWNICIEREKKRACQLDERNANSEVSIQRTDLVVLLRATFWCLPGQEVFLPEWTTILEQHYYSSGEKTRHLACVAAQFSGLTPCPRGCRNMRKDNEATERCISAEIISFILFSGILLGASPLQLL